MRDSNYRFRCIRYYPEGGKVRSTLGFGIPGFQPTLIGGGGGVAGGTGMVGGQERAMARLRNRKTMNPACAMAHQIKSTEVTRLPACTPFRMAMNAGDYLGTFNQAPLPDFGTTNQLSGVRGGLMHYKKDGTDTGSAGFSGNQKFVYDSSDYVKFKSQKAKLRTYDDRSFGGAGAGRGGVGRMAITVNRALGAF